MKLEACTHGAELRLAHETGAVAAVFSAEAFWHQDFNGLAEQFDAFVAEEFFGLGVDDDNAAFLADNHNTVGSGLDERPVDSITYGNWGDWHGSLEQMRKYAGRNSFGEKIRRGKMILLELR
jgi:hypothetical protein